MLAKKDIEILLYVLIEVGLAIAIGEWKNLSPELQAILGAVFVYFGKKIVKKIKK